MLAPLPKHVVNACDYDLGGQAVKIAEAIIDRTGLADALEWSLTSAVGRPRKATWRMILVVFATAGILGTDMLITKVARVATSMAANGHLPPSSVSYDQLTDGLDRFTAELESGRIVTAHTHPLVVDRRTGVVHPPAPRGMRGRSTDLARAVRRTAAARVGIPARHGTEYDGVRHRLHRFRDLGSTQVVAQTSGHRHVRRRRRGHGGQRRLSQ